MPAGFSRVTHILHRGRGSEKIVDHGPGELPPPRPGQGSACPNGDSSDQCDTNSWDGQKWFVLPVEWSLNLAGSPTDPEGFEAAFEASSKTWEDDPTSSFTQSYLGLTDLTASSFTNGPSSRRMDGANVAEFGDLSRYSNAIAVVIYWYFTSTGEIVEADMRLNAAYPWTANTGIVEPDSETGDPCCFDVRNIVTHEFGHFHAGLNDQYDPDESELTMYGYGSLGELKNWTLGLGDQLSIASAYPNGPGGCTGNTDCDDGDDCNGLETCDTNSGICQAGTPVDCGEGDACTVVSCNPADGSCSSVDISCDDGETCTADSCDPESGCMNLWPACGVDDGCCGPTCDSNSDTDCGSTICGNGVCEGDGEDCMNCPGDCRSAGKDAKNGCCGDGFCTGSENPNNCAADCP